MSSMFSDPTAAASLSAWESQVSGLLDSMESADKDSAKRLANLRERSKSIRDDVKASERAASGFDAPRFTVAAEIAKLWNATFPVDNYGKRAPMAETAAKSAIAVWERRSQADRTDKTAKGGTDASVVTFIMLGEGAERVRGALVQRLAYWQNEYDSAEGENQAETAKIKANAARYLTPANKDKHVGGPSGVFNGIQIGDPDGKPRGGTNRTAQVGLLARLYRDHGANALHRDVVDAILDNGGKRVKVDTLADLCGEAVELLNRISAMGGSDSGDEALLSIVRQNLNRIAADGKFSPKVAATPPVIAAPVATPPAPVATPPAQDAPDASKLLAADPATLTGVSASATTQAPTPRKRGNMAA